MPVDGRPVVAGDLRRGKTNRQLPLSMNEFIPLNTFFTLPEKDKIRLGGVGGVGKLRKKKKTQKTFKELGMEDKTYTNSIDFLFFRAGALKPQSVMLGSRRERPGVGVGVGEMVPRRHSCLCSPNP